MNATPPQDADNPLADIDFALRSDIRRLGNQLGGALVRQHGPELLEQVEEVRRLSMDLRRRTGEQRREHSTALEVFLAGVDIQEAGLLARAFTVYFHLANTAEQVHRIDDLTEKLGSASHRFAETVERLQQDGSATARSSKRSTACNYDPCSPPIPPRRHAGRSSTS